jgi:hypothetical protein
MPTKKFYVTKDASVALRPPSDSLGQGAGDNVVLGKQPTGAAEDLWLYRGFMYFPVDFTGMATVTSATINLYAYNRASVNITWEFTGSPTADGMQIRAVTATWSEGTKGADGIWWYNNAIAWNNQPATTATSAVDITSGISNTRPSHGTRYSFDITGLVRYWAPSTLSVGGTNGANNSNHGVRLAMRDETTAAQGGVEFCSKEDDTINGGTSYDAYIEITYTTASTVPSNTIIAPTASKVADIVNLNDLATWTGATALARPRLSWDYVANDGGAQAEWRVKIYSASTAGTTLLDSGWVSDPNHSASETVDIPQSIASATHMPGGITVATSSSTVPVWSSGDATYTTASNHNLDTGMVVNITGFDQDGYNVSGAVVTYINSTTFTVPIATDPGTATAGTTGTVATIWYTGYKGLVNNTPYWWTVTTRGSAGLESAESARTAFKVIWGQTRHEYTYTTSSYSYVHSIGSTPSATEVARIFGTTASSATAPSAWYSSLDSAIVNRGANTILVVDMRVGILNNNNTARGSAPTITGTLTSISGATTPDDWALNSGSHTLELVSTSRRFGTRSAQLTVNDTSGLAQPYRLSAGDGIAVVPNTNYVFSTYVSDGDGVAGNVTLRVYPGSAANASVTGETALATSDAHTAFEEDSDGWRRMYVFFNSSGNDKVRPAIYCDGWTSGQSILLDGSIVEEGTVIRSYTPGLVNSPAVIEGGGVQIDALQGGVLRLRGSSGGLRDVIELGANGLVFGGAFDTANLYSPSANTLQTDDSLVVGGSLSAAGTLTLGSSIIHQAADNVQEFKIVEGVSLAARAATVATITTTYDHQMLLGQLVTVALTSGPTGYAALNGSWTITGTPTTTSFTFSTVTTGTITSGAAVGTVTTTAAAVQPHGVYIPTAKAVVFEGAADNVLETFLVASDPTTTDKTITLPDATGTVALTSNLTGTTLALTGDLTLAATAITIGAANSLSVAVNNDSHSHTGTTLSGITLGTDTTGDYVGSITSANSLISVSGSGAEGAAVVLTGDLTPTFTTLTVSGAAEFDGAVTLGDTTADSIRFLNMFQTTTITNSFNPRVYNASGTTPWRIFYDTSSERFKTNIVYMEDTDAILDVNPVSYHDKTDYEANGEESPRQYGFLAEDMAANTEGIAFVVHNGADAETIQYERLVVPLFSAMRSLRARIEELEARIAELDTSA